MRRLATSEDLIQDVALRLIMGIRSTGPAPGADLSRWAYVQLCRALADLARKLYGHYGYGKNMIHATDMSSGGGAVEREVGAEPAPEINAVDGEAWAAFYAGAQQLIGNERDAFDLVWFEQLTQKEAARRLQLSER